jgi:hypothetical protein
MCEAHPAEPLAGLLLAEVALHYPLHALVWSRITA